MAQIKTKGNITGAAGAVYFRTLNGKQIVQTKPDRRKQDTSKNTSAMLFKNTVSDLSVLRQNIVSFLGKRQDNKVHQRLLSKVFKTLRRNAVVPLEQVTLFNTSLVELSGFQWNENIAFNDVFLSGFQFEIQTDNIVEVVVEAFSPIEQVRFPPTCTHATLRLAMFSLQEDRVIYIKNNNQLIIEFTKEQSFVNDTGVQFSTPTSASLSMIVVEIQFYYPINGDSNQLTLFNSKDYNPSAILLVK